MELGDLRDPDGRLVEDRVHTGRPVRVRRNLGDEEEVLVHQHLGVRETVNRFTVASTTEA